MKMSLLVRLRQWQRKEESSKANVVLTKLYSAQKVCQYLHAICMFSDDWPVYFTAVRRGGVSADAMLNEHSRKGIYCKVLGSRQCLKRTDKHICPNEQTKGDIDTKEP